MIFLNLSLWDYAAVALFLGIITYLNFRVESETSSPPSTYSIMTHYRGRWMEVLTTRENRIVDAQILAMLQQSSRFFSSGMMIAIGALVALMARPELQMDLEDIFQVEISKSLWNLKLFFTALILANGFFKFLWASRVFGYCAVVMASVPEDSDVVAKREAARATKLNVAASKSFNRGLRMIYFALAAMCWLLGAVPFLIATLIVAGIIWRREYHSQTRRALLDGL